MTSSSNGKRNHRWIAYAISILGCSLIVLLRLLNSHHWGDRYPFAFFYGVMVISAWIGGVLPGILAMALGWLSVIWVMPALSIFQSGQVADRMGQILYIGQSCLIIAGFSTMRHRIEAISEKRRAEAALAKSQQQLALSLAEAEINLRRLRMIEDEVEAGTWEFDVASGISTWPPGISSLWGLPQQEHHVTFDDFSSRIYPEDRERVVQTVQSALADGETYDIEFRVVWPDKSIHWLSVRGAVIHDGKGHARKVIGIALEVTQRKHTERALRQSEKLAATGRMAATIAHEINNPLEAVVNLVFLAKSDPNLSPQTKEYLSNADAELTRVSHMVRQTLGFYRENSTPGWIDVASMVEQVAVLYRNKLIHKNIRLNIRTSPAEIFCVEGELRQVISNLVSNAIDAVKMNGWIGLRARKIRNDHETFVRILVADNGHGIAPENHNKLFQPFFTTKTNVGTGLGLWVSKGIIEKHNGRIRLRTRSGPTYWGTVFCVELPIEQNENAT